MGRKRGAVAALVALGSFAGGAYVSKKLDRVFRSAFSRTSEWKFDRLEGADFREAIPAEKYSERRTEFKEWFKSQKFDEFWTESSRDGIRLHAEYLSCEEPERIVLCAHGYRGRPDQFTGIAKWLNSNGCDILFINQRGTVKSGGEWITFGALEQYDVVDWVNWLHDHNYGNLPIYMYGVSMGGATVACASGHILPDDVAGVIIDCGFSSLENLINDYAEKWIRISPAPIIKYIEQKCISEAGFDMRTANPEARLMSCKIPALFIHGTGDTLVDPKHTVKNYKACASKEKDVLWIDGAEHSVSFYKDSVRYEQALTDFFAKCESNPEY